MAWFHFSTANHYPVGRITLVDMADCLRAGLEDLGHKVTFSENAFESAAINILWECFTPGMGKTISETGVTYGIIATEIPDGHGFNWRKEPAWKERFEAFGEVAKGASFIWTMLDRTVPFYSQYGPTSYVEMGFSERLIPDYINDEPRFDFSFFGIQTPHRERAIEKLRQHSEVYWSNKFLSPDQVGKLIGATKVGLCFKQSEQWPVPSPSRLVRIMMAKRAVAAEHVTEPTRQSMLVGHCPESMDFSEYALTVLNSDWRRRAEDAFLQYREKLPMKDIMQSVLDHTIVGLVPNKNTASPVSVTHLCPPEFMENVDAWVIVRWNNEYFGFMRRLGIVDVTLSQDLLTKRYGQNQIMHSSSVDELRKKIALRAEGMAWFYGKR